MQECEARRLRPRPRKSPIPSVRSSWTGPGPCIAGRRRASMAAARAKTAVEPRRSEGLNACNGDRLYSDSSSILEL
jgi:hypothetical protein